MSGTVIPCLISKQVYKDNKLFSSEDPYGRKTFYAYRASDAALVRTIQATVPSVTFADFAAVTAATRAPASTANPTSLIIARCENFAHDR